MNVYEVKAVMVCLQYKNCVILSASEVSYDRALYKSLYPLYPLLSAKNSE